MKGVIENIITRVGVVPDGDKWGQKVLKALYISLFSVFFLSPDCPLGDKFVPFPVCFVPILSLEGQNAGV